MQIFFFSLKKVKVIANQECSYAARTIVEMDSRLCKKEIFTLMARSPLENRKFAELLCNISKIRIVLAAYALLTHK